MTFLSNITLFVNDYIVHGDVHWLGPSPFIAHVQFISAYSMDKVMADKSK